MRMLICLSFSAMFLWLPACDPGPPSANDNQNANANDSGGDEPIVVTDVVSTIAGTGTAGFSGDDGSSTSARINNPAGLNVAPDGAVIVADFGNHRIRRINLMNGRITTIAGTGETSGDGALFFPTAVTFNTAGDMFVASWADDTIYRYTNDGARERFAGSGVSACDENDPGMPAVQATICQPRSLDVLADQSLLFAEQGCDRIRRVTLDGQLLTYAGTGESGYEGDDGLAVDATFMGIGGDEAQPNFGMSLSRENPPDQLYIADTGNNVIREIQVFTGAIKTFAGNGGSGFDDGPPLQASLDFPTAVFLSQDHAVWIVDTGNHAIRRVDPLVTEMETIIGTGTGGFNGDGLPPGETQLNNPTGVFVTPDNIVFVADAGNHRIRAFRYAP